MDPRSRLQDRQVDEVLGVFRWFQPDLWTNQNQTRSQFLIGAFSLQSESLFLLSVMFLQETGVYPQLFFSLL